MRKFQLVLTAAATVTAAPMAQGQQLSFVTPKYVIPYSAGTNYIDYRPTIDRSNQYVVFERTAYNKSTGLYPDISNLYFGRINSTAAPTPFVPIVANVSTSRPDWCWKDIDGADLGKVTFTQQTLNADGKATSGAIIFTNSNPVPPAVTLYTLPNSNKSMFYPTWFPGCRFLAIDVEGSVEHYGVAGPGTGKYDLKGSYVGSLSGSLLWAGYPSINRHDPNLVALAAQRFSVSPSQYTENLNYVYISNVLGSPPGPKPLDPGAPTNKYGHQFEGRAPNYSPDGQWIAFESDRKCPKPIGSINPVFAIFLQDALGKKPAMQVTDCKYNSQHAKWFSQPVNGRVLLITSARRYSNDTKPVNGELLATGIATLDVTAFLRQD